MTKEAIPEVKEWGPLMRLDSKRKGILRTHLERGATKFSFRDFRFFTRGRKEAIKIAGRCASRLGNFQRIAFNMIGI